MKELLEAPQIGERRDLSLKTTIRQGKNDDEVFSFIISKQEEDRHGTVVDVRGIDVDAFNTNPVVLFNHNYDKVIGTAFNVRVVGDTLQASVRFDDDEMSQEIKGKVERGVLKATSIGFMVKEWSFDEENDVWKILKSELLEFSIVTVPSNRSALIMRDAQVNTLTETIERLSQQVSVLSERLKQPVIEITGKELVDAVNKQTDQPNQLDPNEPSTRKQMDAIRGAADELAETDNPVPGDTDKSVEKDPSHDTRADESKPVTKYTLAEMWAIIDDKTDRMLGKK